MENEGKSSEIFTGQYVSGQGTGQSFQTDLRSTSSTEFAQEVAAQYNHEAKPERVQIHGVFSVVDGYGSKYSPAQSPPV